MASISASVGPVLAPTEEIATQFAENGARHGGQHDHDPQRRNAREDQPFDRSRIRVLNDERAESGRNDRNGKQSLPAAALLRR